MRYLENSEESLLWESNKAVITFLKEDCEFCEKLTGQIIEHVEPVFVDSDIDFFAFEVDDAFIRKHQLSTFPVVGVFKNQIEFATFIGTFDFEDENRSPEGFVKTIKHVLGGS